MAIVRGGRYTLKEGDEDLQTGTFPAFGRFHSYERCIRIGKDAALRQINSRIAKLLEPEGPVTRADFVPVMTAMDIQTHIQIAVEWRAVRQGKSGEHWVILLNMDDPTLKPPIDPRIPDRPHIGYEYWREGSDQGKGRFKGHIFVDAVPACRPPPAAFKNR